MSDRCLFFGCWDMPGHFLVGPGGRRSGLPDGEDQELSNTLDGVFAPKLLRGTIIFGHGMDWDTRTARECPQGQFLRHRHGKWTLIQWWDRNQGDKRGACNSTILLSGEHTTEEMLAALKEHFPHVLANLEKAGVQLVEVFP